MLIESVFSDYQVASLLVYRLKLVYSMFSFRSLTNGDVYPKDWAAVLTNIQTPFYAQNPTLISALENSKSAMAGKLIIFVMG